MSNDISYDLLNNMPHGFDPQDIEEIAVVTMGSPFGEIHFVRVIMNGEAYAIAESVSLDEVQANTIAAVLTEKLLELMNGSN